MKKYLTHIKYDLDNNVVNELAEQLRSKAKPYHDPRYNKTLDHWHMLKFDHEYLQKIMNDFKVNGSPRFYWQEPYSVIPTHVDNGTQCSLNFVLTDNAAPVTFEDEHDFYYKQCLLNTSLPHSVKNGEHKRLLLKISIFDETYESLAERINYEFT